MIQIELLPYNAEFQKDSVYRITHRCLATVDDEPVGTLYLSVEQAHGRILETILLPQDLEFLDGLVKTAVHQLHWSGILTGSFFIKDAVLMNYFSKFQFPMSEDPDEVHFILEDFINAARCRHG